MSEPDLITVSGRETMTLADRIDLLAADVLLLKASDGNPNWREGSGETFREWDRRDHQGDAGSKAHAFNSLVGSLGNLVHLYQQDSSSLAVARWLSRGECELLAWRRGGFVELCRVRTEIDKRWRRR